MTNRLIAIAALALLTGSCRAASEAPRQEVVWRTIGSWSGRGSSQTESFPNDTGALRVHWEATNERRPGTGAFRVMVHSAVSGRPLQTVVDHRGAGRGTSYVNEDPRVFYVVVESSNLDWTFTVEEGIVGMVSGKPEH